MNSISRKMDDSGSTSAVDNESSSQDSKVAEMNNIRTMLFYKKAFLKNSAKLKSEIHSQISDLIETLKERERQLFLEIDEYDVDCFLLMTDKNKVDNSSEEKACPSIEELLKVPPPSAYLEKKLKFVTKNPNMLKADLQRFGRIEEIKEATFKSGDCDLTQVKKSKFLKLCVRELVKRLSNNEPKQTQNESTGSVESFEVIEGLDLDEYRKYDQSPKDDDDIEVVSSPGETWQANFPIHEIGYSSGLEPNYQRNMISPVHITSQDEFSSDSQQSPDIEGTPDPVSQINEQLQSLLRSSCHAKHQEEKVHASDSSRNLSEQLSPLQTKPKSDGPAFKATTPSAIIQETFNKYLDQSGSGKWLASTNNEKQSRPTYEMSQWLC